MRPVAIIQARMSSQRLPGKVLRPLAGYPMLWHIVQRVRRAPQVAQVVVATSSCSEDEPIRSLCSEHAIACFTGSQIDVLDRFHRAAMEYEADPIIRITADCPFVDPEIIGRLLQLYQSRHYDHVGVATGAGAMLLQEGRFPDGLDAECFSSSALLQAWRQATARSDREHVTPFIWRMPARFFVGMLKADADYSSFRLTVDSEADFELASRLYEGLYFKNPHFLLRDVLEYLEEHPTLPRINQALIGRENYAQVWNPK